MEVCELPEDDPDLMPEEGRASPSRRSGRLRAWIEQGASWEAVMTEEEADSEQEAARAAALERVGTTGAIVLPVALTSALSTPTSPCCAPPPGTMPSWQWPDSSPASSG